MTPETLPERGFALLMRATVSVFVVVVVVVVVLLLLLVLEQEANASSTTAIVKGIFLTWIILFLLKVIADSRQVCLSEYFLFYEGAVAAVGRVGEICPYVLGRGEIHLDNVRRVQQVVEFYIDREVFADGFFAGEVEHG